MSRRAQHAENAGIRVHTSRSNRTASMSACASVRREIAAEWAIFLGAFTMTTRLGFSRKSPEHRAVKMFDGRAENACKTAWLEYSVTEQVTVTSGDVAPELDRECVPVSTSQHHSAFSAKSAQQFLRRHFTAHIFPLVDSSIFGRSTVRPRRGSTTAGGWVDGPATVGVSKAGGNLIESEAQRRAFASER